MPVERHAPAALLPCRAVSLSAKAEKRDRLEEMERQVNAEFARRKIGGITILDPLCVGKTYPEYWDALRSLGVELR